MTYSIFYEAEVNRSHITYKVSPSSWMDFLSVLQPFHLNIWIGNLNGHFYSVSLCHLVGRIQLSEERWVSEILSTQYSVTVGFIYVCGNSIVWVLNLHKPALFFSSFFIFFSLLSIPLRSVMPYWKAIFWYSEEGAFLRISHTSTSGSVLVCTALIHTNHRLMSYRGAVDDYWTTYCWGG